MKIRTEIVAPGSVFALDMCVTANQVQLYFQLAHHVQQIRLTARAQ